MDALGGGYDDPRTQGLLTLGLQLLASRQPRFGQALGEAGMSAMQAYQGARQGQQREAALKMRMDAELAQAAQQAEQRKMRERFLADQAGNMGPPQAFNPAQALAAGISADEAKMLQGPAPAAPIQLDPTKALVRIGPDGQPQVLREATPKAPNVPASWEEFQLAMKNPEFAAFMERMRRAGAGGGVTLMAPIPVQQADGSVTYVQPGNKPGAAPQPLMGPDGKPLVKPAGAEKEPTEGERKAGTLLQRLRQSQAQLAAAVQESPSAAKPGFWAETVRKTLGDTPANALTPAARQRVEAAQLDILDAALTLGTGAAYTREQLEGYRRAYFPQIGDDQATIRDKQARLRNVIEAAEIAAGRVTKNIPQFPSGQPGLPASADIEAELRRRGALK